jgi:hypothetical protein
MSGLLLTSRSLVTSGSFLTIAGLLIALAGVVFSVWFYLSPRKANEAPPAQKHLPTLRLWRPKEYSLAFAYLHDYCEALKSKCAEPMAAERHGLGHQDQNGKLGARGFVSDTDLVRWTVQQALTCAATLVPRSLGKATLFRVSDIKEFGADDPWLPFRREVSVYSSQFVGVFSPDQLTHPQNSDRIRTFRMGGPDQGDSEVPMALKCLRRSEPLLDELPRGSAFDAPDRTVGTTHVVAIPLRSRSSELVRWDQPVAITVDLRFRSVRWWWLNKVRFRYRNQNKHPVYRRARALMTELRDIVPLWDAVELRARLQEVIPDSSVPSAVPPTPAGVDANGATPETPTAVGTATIGESRIVTNGRTANSPTSARSSEGD